MRSARSVKTKLNKGGGQTMIYEIFINKMDEACNNSIDCINLCGCKTLPLAKKEVAKAVKRLQKGDYNDSLKGIQYVYISAIPYDDNYDCIVGVAQDIITRYYKRVDDRWVAQ